MVKFNYFELYIERFRGRGNPYRVPGEIYMSHLHYSHYSCSLYVARFARHVSALIAVASEFHLDDRSSVSGRKDERWRTKQLLSRHWKYVSRITVKRLISALLRRRRRRGGKCEIKEKPRREINKNLARVEITSGIGRVILYFEMMSSWHVVTVSDNFTAIKRVPREMCVFRVIFKPDGLHG